MMYGASHSPDRTEMSTPAMRMGRRFLSALCFAGRDVPACAVSAQCSVLSAQFVARVFAAGIGLLCFTARVALAEPDQSATQPEPHPVRAPGTPAIQKTDHAQRPFVPTSEYETRTVEGWTVRVNRHLLTDRKDLGDRALQLLETRLYEVRRAVPERACGELLKVPIWLGVDDGHAPCSEYHPSRDWLAGHGFNPDKAKAVEIGNAQRFLDWSKDQPSMVLHELAHAYHDQVLGFDNAKIKAAYRHAVETGLYDSVLRANGKTERAYAVTDAQEYFAEGTEAFFGTNDFYPFVRVELEKHDPELAKLLGELWGR
jgi:hypothetical protein